MRLAALWKEIPTQLWHTAVLYAVAFLVLRLVGKRSVGRMAPFDVMVVIMIGEAVAIGIEEPTKPLLLAIVPVVFLGLLQFGLVWINARVVAVENITQGTDTLVVKDGKILRARLRAEHLSLADLMTGLREQGVEKIGDVKEARLEPNGKISVILREEVAPLTPKDIGLKGQETLEQLIEQKLEALRKDLLAVMEARVRT
jgi:uncharacterized membrane protein YcaP (DUF421 family)